MILISNNTNDSTKLFATMALTFWKTPSQNVIHILTEAVYFVFIRDRHPVCF